MTFHRYQLAALAAILVAATAYAEDKKIFSGPQVGEKLPPLKVKGVFGEQSGKEFDFVKLAAGKPTVLIFLHKRERPAVGVIRAVMRFCGKKTPGDVFAGVVMLTDDATTTETWLKISSVKKALAADEKNVHVGISPDGQEGPGAYGLNRNVTLTILVANKGKVTANFPLVQPSVQVDVPKVLKKLIALTGGKLPEPELGIRALLGPVINKRAKPDAVDKAAKRVEAYVKTRPAVRQRIGAIARRIIDAGKLKNYGTTRAQEYLTKWAKEFKAPKRKPNKKRD